MKEKTAITKICDSIIAITDDVCKKHLNQDYAELANKLAMALSRKRPSPLLSGAPKSWACAIVYALGQVNFIFDKSQTPHFSAKELCAFFGVSTQTASAKAKAISDMMKMMPFDPHWCTSQNLAHNPLLQLAETIEMLDYAKEQRHAQELLAKMTAQLPIPAYPIQSLVNLMHKQGYKLAVHQKLSIKSVLYMGDEGGIGCDVTLAGETATAFLVSVTHLQIDSSHPLAEEIGNYQKNRIKRLRAGH